MPDSLLKRAYHATSFFSVPKAIGAISLSVLTLLWNYEFGMRDWDTTKTFLLCLLLGYASLALIALVWNLGVLGAKDWWAAFVGGMRADIFNVIKDAATQAAPVNQPPMLIERWQLKKLEDFLSDKTKGAVRVVGEDGNPDAYSLTQRLANAFEQSGWTVTKGSVKLGFSRKSVFILDHERDVSKYSSLVGEALLASSIAFERYKMRPAEFVICTVYITAQRP